MRNKFNQLKQFFRLYNARREFAAARRYLSKAAVVDLSPEEKAFVNKETYRMLLRKTARIQQQDPRRDWTASLQPMPHRGSAYAIHTAR